MKNLLTFIFTLLVLITINLAANANTLTVTKSTNSDDGVCNADCSLREAVAAANNNDTVVFNSNLVGQTFVLGGTEITVTKHITLDGALNAPNVVFLSGEMTSRHFYVLSGGELILKNMILVQGNGQGVNVPGQGGSIGTESGGRLLLDRVSIRGNQANQGGALSLLGNASHVITNTSITGNKGSFGMAITVGSNSDLYMSNTTISHNRVLNPNGDWGTLTSFSDHVVLRNCTITDNESISGGGIFAGGDPAGTFDIGNTIIAGNTATGAGQDILHTAIVSSSGGNLIGNMDTVPGGVFNKTKDVTNANPRLAPTNAQQGGHPVDTHPLQAGSAAINGGINSMAVEPFSNTALAHDARGIDFPRQAGSSVDKGAFEDQSNGASLVVSKLADTNDHICDIDCSLREAVEAAGTDPGTDNITMAANVFGTMPVNGEIDIQNNDVTITGYPSLSSETLIIAGDNFSRVFYIENSNVTMTGFAISNGGGHGTSEPFGGGAIFITGGSTILNQMIVRNSHPITNSFGGAIATVSPNVVRIMNSTINNNSAGFGVGLDLNGGVNYITNTTVSTNSDNDGGDCNGAIAANANTSLYMRNSTITLNRCSTGIDGAGLYCFNSSTCNLGNNIIANNLAANNSDLNVVAGSTLQSVGGNLVQTITGYNNSIFVAPNDQIGVGANLMPLSDYGGNVPTHMLNVGSAAINSGWNPVATDPFSSAQIAYDARGSGFNRISGGVVDKGAFEAVGPTAATVNIGGRVLTSSGKGLANATVVLTGPNGFAGSYLTNSFGYYHFDDVEVGHTYVISVSSKRYSVEPLLVNVNEENLNLDLFAK